MEIDPQNPLYGPPWAPKDLAHVVILGAGASRDAWENWGRTGTKLPLMSELPEVLGKSWDYMVRDSGMPEGLNFEEQYAWFASNEDFARDLRHIERLLDDYFYSINLPNIPTIYDYLVLGLRDKDLIATFNWDPLLMAAWKRNKLVGSSPDIRFLHGCVDFASCEEHDIIGRRYEICPHCKERLKLSELAFPVGEKDYATDPIIDREWGVTKKALKRAFHLTIYGYSGPETDYKAKQLLLDSWKERPGRDISHVEIIDVAEQDGLIRNWKEFFRYHHYVFPDSFWDSYVARWPRRTIDHKLLISTEGVAYRDSGPFRTDSLAGLQDWFGRLIDKE